MIPLRVDERIELLDEARRMIESASSMITEASKGTVAELSSKKIVSAIAGLLSSPEESVETLKKNIEHDGNEDALWTRPLVSVKNAHRRDI